jgi:tetratricopeptide (TPR) repeat protein
MSKLDRLLKKAPPVRTVPFRSEPDVPAELLVLYSLACDCVDKYEAGRQLIALNSAIATWEAISLHPIFPYAELSFRSRITTNLAGLYVERYYQKHDKKDVDKAVRCLQEVVSNIPGDSELLPRCLSNLGAARVVRAQARRDQRELDEAIVLLQRAAIMMPQSVSNVCVELNNLGNGLIARFDTRHELADINEAIDAYERAMKLIPKDDREQLARNARDLVRALHDRRMFTYDSADHDRAEELTEEYHIRDGYR